MTAVQPHAITHVRNASDMTTNFMQYNEKKAKMIFFVTKDKLDDLHGEWREYKIDLVDIQMSPRRSSHALVERSHNTSVCRP